MKVADFKDDSVDIVMIIDASGSMDSLGKEVVDGFNQFLSKQLEEPRHAPCRRHQRYTAARRGER